MAEPWRCGQCMCSTFQVSSSAAKTKIFLSSASSSHGWCHGPLVCPNRKRTVPPKQRNRLTTRMQCRRRHYRKCSLKLYGSPWSLHVDTQYVGMCNGSKHYRISPAGCCWLGPPRARARRRHGHIQWQLHICMCVHNIMRASYWYTNSYLLLTGNMEADLSP